MYKLYLNGKFYGKGGLVYINELISDYVLSNKIYYKDEVEFKIVKSNL